MDNFRVGHYALCGSVERHKPVCERSEKVSVGVPKEVGGIDFYLKVPDSRGKVMRRKYIRLLSARRLSYWLKTEILYG